MPVEKRMMKWEERRTAFGKDDPQNKGSPKKVMLFEKKILTVDMLSKS